MGGGSAPVTGAAFLKKQKRAKSLFLKKALKGLEEGLRRGLEGLKEKGFFGVLHNDMGGAPPCGGGCALPRPPAFLIKRAKSPFLPPLNPL